MPYQRQQEAKKKKDTQKCTPPIFQTNDLAQAILFALRTEQKEDPRLLMETDHDP